MSVPIQPLAVSAYTVTSALGQGLDSHLAALSHGRGGLRENDFSSAPLACWIGRVDGVEEAELPAAHASWECRNNRLAWLGLQQDRFLEQALDARLRYGAARVALVLGTSTASIGATEEGYRHLDEHGQMPAELRRPAIHAPHSLAAFVAEALGLE